MVLGKVLFAQDVVLFTPVKVDHYVLLLSVGQVG